MNGQRLYNLAGDSDLYNRFKDNTPAAGALEKRIAALMMDDDVTRKAGIYPYVLDGAEKHLSLLAFTANMKREAYERQEGICPQVQEALRIERNGSRPHHPLARRRQNHRGQLPDALQGG